MSVFPDDHQQKVRVESDGAEIEAPRDQAVTAVLEEGEHIDRA
jgi:hemolysin III